MEHRGWTSRGYLPHCDAAHLIQHIVFGTIGARADRRFGDPLLDHPRVAEAVERALLHFDGERYWLLAWCIMPNHVHAIARQEKGWRLAQVVHSWKSFTANQINKIHGRTGAVWRRDYFDRFMRSDAELAATIQYVEDNPVSAKPVASANEWPWSSARLRP